MKTILVFVICFIGLSLAGEYARKPNLKKDLFREKDLKQVKARWTPTQDMDWGDDMMQKPIDEPPRRTNRDMGEMCTYSRDCGSGCCLLDRHTKVRSCQPKSVKGEKCSNAQVKADIYVDACPCEGGYNNNEIKSESTSNLLLSRIIRQARAERSKKVRTNFQIIEMPEHMQSDAIDFAFEALELYSNDYNEAADYLCRMFEKKYNQIWSCVIGPNFGYSVEPEPGKYMLFYVGNINTIRVMAFVAKS